MEGFRMKFAALAAVLACAWAAPAFAQDDNSLESRLSRVEQQLSQPSAREIQSSVDAYLSTAKADASLVGGSGSAGYDGGFWIRGGSFLLKINLTIQTRFEAFRWDDEDAEPSPGGDLSGFSLPRVTLKFSGDATCDIHYYAELEFGHHVDVLLASTVVGVTMPGYSDRNRDYGFMVHGSIGCDGEWSYLVTVTNGDGPVRRNILDQFTNDNLAYSARVNWDIKGHMGYEEGALRQHDCGWVASVGAWAHYYTDVLFDKSHTNWADRLCWGVDAAVGYGSWSLTAAYSAVTFDQSD